MAGIDAPLGVAALHVVVSMTSSALLGLALWRRRFDAEHIWRLAHIDEDHQIAKWGEDDEAMARRKNHFRDMKAAAFVIGELAPPSP
jgi:chaperone required for assembly of F1-ATPase